MSTGRSCPGLQIRVFIGSGSPLHRTLSALPAASRAAALVRLAEAHAPDVPADPLAAATERLATETARVAQVLQALVAGGAPGLVPSAASPNAADPADPPDPLASAPKDPGSRGGGDRAGFGGVGAAGGQVAPTPPAQL